MQRIFRIFRKVLPLLLLFAMVNLAAQQEESHRKHMLGPSVGFTFIPLGNDVGYTDARGLFAPTVGVDYFYHIHPKWGMGFIGAVELDKYTVTDEEVERENAMILTLVGMYRATEYLDLFMGGGIEMEQHDNFGVFRIGVQYAIEVRENWALIPKLYLDVKGGYNTWSFAVSFVRRL